MIISLNNNQLGDLEMKKFVTFLFVLVFIVSASLSFGQYKKGVTNLNAGVSLGGLAGFRITIWNP
mgnify:CR=1 FL=1